MLVFTFPGKHQRPTLSVFGVSAFQYLSRRCTRRSTATVSLAVALEVIDELAELAVDKHVAPSAPRPSVMSKVRWPRRSNLLRTTLKQIGNRETRFP